VAVSSIDVDYEDLEANDRDAYSTFVRELAAAVHAGGRISTSTVHPKVSDAGDDGRNAAQDYGAIGAAVDEVRVMTYDYPWDTSPPGPIAPADWVREVIAWTVTEIPRHKVVLGVVLLGYDWRVGGVGTTVDYLQATALASAHHVRISRTRDGSPSFAYSNRGRRHAVWFEDATSVRAKLDLARTCRLGGLFFWRLGGEDPAVWATTPLP
jgi:spore germination protein